MVNEYSKYREVLMKTLRGVSSIVLMVSFALLCLSPGPEAALLFSQPIDYSTSLPSYITKGDFNNDSITDIAVTSWTNNNVTVFLGDGTGGFTARSPRTVAPGTHPNKIVTGYFDSDSNLDVAIALGIPRTIIILFGDGDGNFTTSNTVDVGSDSDANALVSGFFDGNTTADIAVAKDSSVGPDHVRIFSGDGAGGFTSISSTPLPTLPLSSPMYIITADFNGDLKADLAIANYTDNTVTILLGNGDGSFAEAAGSPVAVGTNPATIFAADFNKDNIVDLAVANLGSSTVSVLLGNGSGGFSEAAGSPLSAGSGTAGITSADFNLDGNADLAVTNNYDGTVSVFEGNGDGTFKTRQDFNVGTQPGDMIAADFNGDGRPDIAFVRNGNMSVLINNPQCVQPPSGLISWWGGDNNALDMVGTNNGTLMGGATYAPGKVGQAFSFSGAGDYVLVPHNSNLNANNITVDAWIKTPGTGDMQLIADKSHGTCFGGGGSDAGWVIQVNTAGRIDFGYGNGDPNWTNAFTSSTSTVTDNNWHHVVGTLDGATIKVYVDGLLESSSPYNGPPQTNTRPVYIGKWHNTTGGCSNRQFNGLIDEVEIFDHALSPSEIAAIYNAGSAGKCRSCTPAPPDMVSWWKGDGNANDIISGYNGTLQGGATYAPGKVGQAFSFDGAEASYIEIPDTAAFNPSGAFSVDGWFYIDPAANAGKIATLVAKTEGSTNDGWALYFDDRAGVGASKSLKFVLGTVLELQNAIPTTNWYHIAGVFDPSTTPNSRIYINGVLVASVDCSGATPNGLNVRIGAMYWTDYYHQGNDRLNGKADEVEFYNRALSLSEIQAIYNAGSAGKCRSCVAPPANMVSWWKGDGDSLDNFGANHGTLMGGATFAPGMVGQAFSFNGTSSYVVTPLATAATDSVTLDAWVKWSGPNAATARQLILYNGNYDSAGYGLFAENDGTLLLLVGHGTSEALPTNVVLSQGSWQHVVAVRSGGTWSVYLNGQAQSIVSGNISASPNVPTTNTIIGGANGQNYFNGLIDEVEIFNRALTADDIASIYNAGSAGKCFTPDTTPEGFTFTDVTGATRSTVYTSNSITASGINSAAPISITICTNSGTCEYQINSGSWVFTAGTVNNGDSVKVRQTSSGSYSTKTDLTLSIGGVTDTFSVTTLAAPPPTYIITANVKDGTGGTLSCDSPVNEGSPSVCTITPGTGYYLSALTDNGGDVLGSVVSTTYTISGVTEAHTVEATFSEYMIKRVSSSDHYYNLLTEVFAEVTGSDTVMLRQGTFTGSAYNRAGVSITLKGGYNTGFGSNTDQHSTISGQLTISNGTVTAENVTIQ